MYCFVLLCGAFRGEHIDMHMPAPLYTNKRALSLSLYIHYISAVATCSNSVMCTAAHASSSTSVVVPPKKFLVHCCKINVDMLLPAGSHAAV